MNFDNVLQVVLGTESPALAKLKANSKVTSEFFSRPSSSASVPGTVFHSGFLFKKGGSKGGRRNWTRVRGYLELAMCPLVCSACSQLRIARVVALIERLCQYAWLVQRWHVLDGSTVNYYKNPKDTTPKGTFSVIGAAPAAVLDSKYSFCFEVCWSHACDAPRPHMLVACQTTASD